MYVCLSHFPMYVLLCGLLGALCACVHTCMWFPEVNVGLLPHPHTLHHGSPAGSMESISCSYWSAAATRAPLCLSSHALLPLPGRNLPCPSTLPPYTLPPHQCSAYQSCRKMWSQHSWQENHKFWIHQACEHLSSSDLLFPAAHCIQLSE